MDWVLLGFAFFAGVAVTGLTVAVFTDISGRCPVCYPEDEE